MPRPARLTGVDLLSLRPHMLPGWLRGWSYALAVAVLLYLCLAPGDDLPSEPLWDKAEHSTAWAVLAGLGLAFWPWRPGRVTAFAVGLGALVEVLQTVLPFGRDGDLRDLFADSIGIAAALLAWALLRRLFAALRVEPA